MPEDYLEDEYRIIQNILRISAYFNRIGDRISSKYNLNQQQFTILNEICSREEIIQKNLVWDLFYEKSNVSKVVKKMIKNGLLEFEKDENDNRVKYLIPTEKGEQIWNECLDDNLEWSREWLSNFSTTELTFALRLTERFKEIIQDETARAKSSNPGGE